MTKIAQIDCPKHGKWIVDQERTKECGMCVLNEVMEEVYKVVAGLPLASAWSRRERLEWLDCHEFFDKYLANM